MQRVSCQYADLHHPESVQDGHMEVVLEFKQVGFVAHFPSRKSRGKKIRVTKRAKIAK